MQEHSSIPPSYKGRVKIEGRATLVIKNINTGDNTKFRCEMWKSPSGQVESTVQLIVAGMYCRHNQTQTKCIQLMSHISEIWRK